MTRLAPHTNASSNLAEIRMRRGWSMNELARRAGVAVGTVHNVENRRVVPREGQLRKLAFALSCSRSWLAADQPFFAPCPCCRGKGRVVEWPEGRS